MAPNTKGPKFAWLDPTSIYINGEAFHDLLDDLVADLNGLRIDVVGGLDAMGFVLGYGAHCFELYGIRTWLVAFWTFVVARHPTALSPLIVILTWIGMSPSPLAGSTSMKSVVSQTPSGNSRMRWRVSVST